MNGDTTTLILPPWLVLVIAFFLVLCVIDLFVTLYRNHQLRSIRARLTAIENLATLIAEKANIEAPAGMRTPEMPQLPKRQRRGAPDVGYAPLPMDGSSDSQTADLFRPRRQDA